MYIAVLYNFHAASSFVLAALLSWMCLFREARPGLGSIVHPKPFFASKNPHRCGCATFCARSFLTKETSGSYWMVAQFGALSIPWGLQKVAMRAVDCPMSNVMESGSKGRGRLHTFGIDLEDLQPCAFSGFLSILYTIPYPMQALFVNNFSQGCIDRGPDRIRGRRAKWGQMKTGVFPRLWA